MLTLLVDGGVAASVHHAVVEHDGLNLAVVEAGLPSDDTTAAGGSLGEDPTASRDRLFQKSNEALLGGAYAGSLRREGVLKHPKRKRGRQVTRNGRVSLSERGTEWAPGWRYWLIAKNENGHGVKVLTVDLAGGEEALPVFGHKEEAEMFLSLGGAGDGWRIRESTAGELVSVLYGPCARVGCVALDPLPVMLEETTVGLVSLSWERFVDLVLSRTRPLAQ